MKKRNALKYKKATYQGTPLGTRAKFIDNSFCVIFSEDNNALNNALNNAQEKQPTTGQQRTNNAPTTPTNKEEGKKERIKEPPPTPPQVVSGCAAGWGAFDKQQRQTKDFIRHPDRYLLKHSAFMRSQGIGKKENNKKLAIAADLFQKHIDELGLNLSNGIQRHAMFPQEWAWHTIKPRPRFGHQAFLTTKNCERRVRLSRCRTLNDATEFVMPHDEEIEATALGLDVHSITPKLPFRRVDLGTSTSPPRKELYRAHEAYQETAKPLSSGLFTPSSVKVYWRTSERRYITEIVFYFGRSGEHEPYAKHLKNLSRLRQ